jgi:hypothetical protein
MRSILLIPVAVLFACGARTDVLTAIEPVEGGVSDGSVPAQATPCTGWEVVHAPRPISHSSGPVGLTSGLALPGGALLSWTCTTFPCDPSVYGGLFGFDGSPLAAGVALFPISESRPSFAPAATGFVGVSWTSADGCRFETLDANAAPSSRLVVLGTSDCTRLLPAGPGFSFLSSPDPVREARRRSLRRHG